MASAKADGGAAALALFSGLKHLAWAAQIARRFGARRAKRGFAKAQITDLATREAIQRENKMATAGAFYDQRRWIRNEFKNVVLEQLLVVRPLVTKRLGEVMRESSSANSQKPVERSRAQRLQLSSLFAEQFPHTNAIVRRTEQVKSMELPLVLAGTRLIRRGGAGSAALKEAEEGRVFELPVLKLTRRHQRQEIALERVTSGFSPHNSMENAQRTTLEYAQTGPATRGRKRLPPAQQEAGDAGTAPLGGMNVTQVADEVMKHLDRRLIAARERMGKI